MSEPGTELARIESTIATDRDVYFRDDVMQERYRELISARDGVPTGRPEPSDAWRGSVEEALKGLPADLAEEWAARPGGAQGAVWRWQDAAVGVLWSIGDRDLILDFVVSFQGLPDSARAAAIREAAEGAPHLIRTANDEEVEAFKGLGCPEFLDAWGLSASRRVAIVFERYNRMLANMTPQAAREFHHWFWTITPTERRAIIWVLSGTGE